MEFRILGPLEAIEDGCGVDLGAQKHRALLAVLLLDANRVVSTDRLIDALWEDAPPETVQKALQVYVSHLRKVVGRDRLERKAPGYVLHVEAGELDLEQFALLRADGRLRDALGLWRGPPLAEFAHLRFAETEIERLEELRLACLEERIEQDLESGRATELVGELEGLVRARPLREPIRRQLMLALYRSGRQAQALEVYQDGRRALVGELGIEPGRALRDLHQAILRQDPALDRDRPPAPASQPETAGPETAGPETARAATVEARDVRKTVTVVAAEVAISAREGETLDPEALLRFTSRAFREIDDAIERHGGIVETVTGEAVTAVFGLPAAHEDDALRAVRAAVDARAALAELAEELAGERMAELHVRLGVSTGEVVASSDTGGPLRTSGPPLRGASTLARSAAAGEVLFDAAVWQLVRDAVAADRAGDAWRLLGIGDGLSAPARRLDSPMVGRSRERRRLTDAFEQACADPSCQLFTVLGLAGVGKSRLVQEFLDGVSGRARVAGGRCLSYGEGITFWPLLETVKELVRLDDGDSPDVTREKLAAAFAGSSQAEALAVRVAATIGLAELSGAAEEGFAAVGALVEALAEREPLVLVFDDIHWAEPRFLDLVEHLADSLRGVPVLLVCIARPELLDIRADWGGGKLNSTTVLLERLSDDECSQLIENLLGRARVAEEVASQVAEYADGNPLFVEEMVSILIDDGLLVRDEGRWVARGGISSVRVPPTIHALLSVRLDQLGADERAAIECAAVAGKVFQEGAVTELFPQPARSGVQDALAGLVRKDLVRAERADLGDRTYRFRHLLIRDAAYDSISKDARAELHERFARWLERTTGGRAIEYEEVLGYHFEQAYRYRRELGPMDVAARTIAAEAAERLGNSGRRAFLRSDAPAGVNLISRAVALLPADDPLRVELVPNVRVVQGLDIDLSWADSVLTSAIEAAATTGDRRLAAHAIVQRGLLRLFTEVDVSPAELGDAAERSIQAFEELEDELGQARAWRLKAQAHYLARDATSCAAASERALEHSRRAGDRFEERENVEWLAIALLLGPARADEAGRRCEQLRREFAHEPLLQAMLLGVQAVLAAMEERGEESAALAAASQKLMRDLGEWVWISFFWLAWISIWAGRAADAERELRPVYERLRQLGSNSHFTSFAHLLGNAVYLQGRYDEAEALTQKCEVASRPNDVHSHVLWRSTRAKVFARRGRAAEARLLADEAVAFASASDFLPAHADALMDLAEILELGGDLPGAATALEQAILLYERKGNVLVAAQARAKLGALSSV
jgi:DNA-binding SARP family transcriptional activator/tetratricopeptide (TPR) repeat protein